MVEKGGATSCRGPVAKADDLCGLLQRPTAKMNGAAVSPQCLVLEIGGSKQLSQPSRLPNSAVVIKTEKLPNPYTAIHRGTLEASPMAIFEWMGNNKATTSDEIDDMIVCASAAFNAGSPVRVECYGGAHRSQTVAWLILRALDPGLRERIRVDVLDAPLMKGF